MAEDPYTVLGLARDAAPEAIRSAYRKLAKQHHPDLNPGDKAAEERFKAVAAAHDLLSDPEQRARYDRGEIDAGGTERPQPSHRRPAWRDYAEAAEGQRYRRAAETPAGGWTEDDLGDIFGNLFGDRSTSRARGSDERYALTVAFLDAVNGATRRLTLPDGRTLDVKVPPGLDDGQVLRLRGQGGAGRNGGPPGDALIAVSVAPHPHFRRTGRDIVLDLPVTLAEAVLGGRVTTPTPAGPVSLTVPAGADTGQQLRLRGRGVPAANGQPAGDLTVTLQVALGPPDPALAAFLRDHPPAQPFDPRRSLLDTP